MGQERFEIVGLWISGENLWGCEGDKDVVGVEINIGVENLSQFRGHRSGAHLDANPVRDDDASERKHTGSETHIRLIEADGIYAVGATGVLSGHAGEWRQPCGIE